MKKNKTVIIDRVEMSYHEAHKKLWYWMAETGRRKNEFFETFQCSIQPRNNCFACEFVGQTKHGFPNCKKCPLTWGTEIYQKDCFCENLNKKGIVPLYDKWKWTSSISLEYSEICRKIAEIPWKEKGVLKSIKKLIKSKTQH